MAEINLDYKTFNPDPPQELNLPRNVFDKLRNYYPWETRADLDNAEKYYYSLSWKRNVDSKFDVNAELTKLKELCSFLREIYDKYIQACSREYEKLELPYYEFVKKVPFIKQDPAYASLTSYDKYKIDEALEELRLPFRSDRYVIENLPQQYVRSHLEVLSKQVQSFDGKFISEAHKHMPGVWFVLTSVSSMIRALEKVAPWLRPMSRCRPNGMVRPESVNKFAEGSAQVTDDARNSTYPNTSSELELVLLR